MAIILCLVPARATLFQSNDYFETGIFEIVCLCISLDTISNDSDYLIFDWSRLISASFQVFAIKKILDSTHIIYILYSLLHLTHLTFTPSESRRSNFFEPQFVQIGHARTGFTNYIFVTNI